MGKRNLYLQTKPVDEALALYLDELKKIVKLSYEIVPVVESLNRVTKHAVYAKYNSPLYNASAMDGIAVVSEKTKAASEMNPLVLNEEDYVVVDTGDPIKYPYDAVIMAEDLIEGDDGKIKIISPASSWQHVRPIGEDIVANEMILPSSHKIRPIDIGVLLSAGILEVEVVKEVHVAIFATGTEIIEPTEEIVEGSIIESNSRVFENIVRNEGAIPHRFPPIIDDYNLIKDAILDASKKYDMVLVNAGSSAGRDDYTVHVLREIGTVYVHGVAIKPGKPVILASVNNKPVIGLPGYPVSAYIGFENFVKPTLSMLMNTIPTSANKIKAVITRRLVSSLKHKEYVRVKVGVVDGKFVAVPLARGAGAAMSLVKADGFCVIEQNSEGLEAGEEVTVELYRSLDEIKNTVVVIGSHDLILDVMADMMPNLYRSSYITSTHVGSMGGLMALKRNEAHLAPTHLLDEETGEYNISYIKRLFNEPYALIKGVNRVQGLIVKKGNPLNISSLSDLTKYRFVNRQRGAGTRVLLDYLLKKEGINAENINGYDREATTHMAVAALVGSDSADVGMGIQSAAKAMDLDFIKIGNEEY
ncbi:MAG: molybdopterin biosynthesis protein, partial [Erysipelotrichales bacterium]|nr:molybdopterin biosynthesis protein [Erysipelotrichales bacterium]